MWFCEKGTLSYTQTQKTATGCMQHSKPIDNIYLMTTVLTIGNSNTGLLLYNAMLNNVNCMLSHVSQFYNTMTNFQLHLVTMAGP